MRSQQKKMPITSLRNELKVSKKKFLNLQTVVWKYHNIESAKIWQCFALWAILLHSFEYFLQAKKCGGVSKLTIIRCALGSVELLTILFQV